MSAVTGNGRLQRVALQWTTIKSIRRIIYHFSFLIYHLGRKAADAALHEERADDGGEHGDDELDDSLPGF